MKRISKSLLVSILLVVTSSGFVGGTAAAKTDTSTETNWSYNSDTKTVTLHGDGSFPYYSNTLFGDITKEIEHVKMDETLLGSETDFFWKNTEDYLPALKTAEGSLGNGFYWFADYTQDTLLISGTGELTLPDGPAYLFPDMDTCILDDDIPSIQTTGRYIRFTNLQLGADININAQFSAGDSLNLSVSDSYSVAIDLTNQAKKPLILLSDYPGVTGLSGSVAVSGVVPSEISKLPTSSSPSPLSSGSGKGINLKQKADFQQKAQRLS